MYDTQQLRVFPEGLIRWSGHREGGVRRPFQRESGRPIGVQLETPLVLRLREWVQALVAGKDVPRSILLVGGPGNGKTDAVEGCIEFLDEQLGADGKLFDKFAVEYNVESGRHPPRKVVVDLSSLPSSAPKHLQVAFSLVQDATEGDPAQGAKAEQALLEEIEALSEPGGSEIYICCVNRGILAHAATIAYEIDADSRTSTLLTEITRCVTSGPTAPACWPLKGFEHIGVWPMDVESLVASRVDADEESVAHQIFGFALDENKWKESCELKSRCPFCQNRKLLARKGALDSLIRVLHYYEISSGKRWTFRDLFSLVPYLLVGDYSELEIRGKKLSPCEWAKEQLRIAREGPKSVERDRAPYLLLSRLYYHRLFPCWPRLDRGDHRAAKRELFKEKYTDEGILAAQALFRFTSRADAIASRAAGDVPNRVRTSVGPSLDPAVGTGDDVLFRRDGRDYTVADIESRFSLSVRDGLDLTGSQLELLERDVIGQLAIADESLVEDRYPRNCTRQARLLQSTVRQFASRVVKRSLGTRKGVCKDRCHFEKYFRLTLKPDALNEVRKVLRNLLHDSNNRFRAGLATTFGQPVAERSRDVALLLPKRVVVHLVPSIVSERRPQDPLIYLQIEGHFVALTFSLFRALEEVSAGLHEASLPREIYSLLDRVKSLVAGQVVRDEQILNEEPQIVLGSSLDTIEYVGGRFHFTRGGLS